LLDGCDAIADMAAFAASEFYRLAIHSGEHLATSQPWRKARRTGK
jgi:hypothetical protein